MNEIIPATKDNLKFKTIIIDGGIFVFIMSEEQFSIGVAEATRIDEERKNVYYFNRLFVKPNYRGKGYSRKLLEKFVQELDTNKISVELDINPYGDLDYNQLKKLYEEFDFKQKNQGFFVREYGTSMQ